MSIRNRMMALAMLMLGASSVAAEALPVIRPPSAEAPAVTLVSDGCGPFGHRSHFGYCKSDGYNGGQAFFGPPRVFAPRPYYGRRCFVRETYYGPRRFCR